jgi:hypothetical protein
VFKEIKELFSIWLELPYAKMLAVTLAVGCLFLKNEISRLNQKIDIRDDTITSLRIQRRIQDDYYHGQIMKRQDDENQILLERLKVKEDHERKLDSILEVNHRFINSIKKK